MQTGFCTRTAGPRVRHLKLGTLVAAAMWLAPSVIATGALAQDQATPLMAAPPGGAPGETQDAPAPEPATPDTVTNERIQQFEMDGLIGRQAALSEGLLLMDRQLRQMQLVEQILAAFGPDAQVEIAPGEFRSFRDTPAGMRQEIAYIDLMLQLAEKRAELDEVRSPSTPDDMFMAGMNGANGEAGTATAAVQPTTAPDSVALGSLVIEEIYGQLGALKAVVQVAGTRLTLRSNDILPTGHRVISIGRDRLAVELRDGGLREFEIR